MQSLLARIAARNPTLRAYVHHDPAQVRRDAAVARGPLAGLGFAVKDTIDVAGQPTEANCRLRRGRIATQDAALVAALRALGAVPLGKAATWELGAGTGEVQELALAPPPLHPADPAAFVGGSSTGSAVAVAAGLADFALGGDTGGSVRCPAASCGVVGIKPSFGLLPTAGAIAHSATLDHMGLIARDAVLLARVLAALGIPLVAPPPRPRIALIADWHDGADPDIGAAVARIATRFGALGAALSPLPAPIGMAEARDLVKRIGLPESLAAHPDVLAAPLDQVSRGLRDWLAPGAALPPEDRERAMPARARLRAAVEAILATHDAILCAGHTRLLPDAAEEAACVEYCLTSPNCVFNLTGHPALSVPTGLDRRGRPIGVQLVGRMGEDVALLGLAARLEAREAEVVEALRHADRPAPAGAGHSRRPPPPVRAGPASSSDDRP